MAKIVKKEDFQDMVNACKGYDPYTQYIDNYRQMEQAQEANACYSKMFDEIAMNYIDGYRGGIPYSCRNQESDTEKFLKEWLKKHDVDVEIQEKQRRVWTEDEIKVLIQTNDTVLYGALKKLYAEQTADEQNDGRTKHYNGVGFNGADSKFLSSVSEFLIKRGFLTDKQKFVVRKKLVKYNKQLTRLANM